MFCLQVLMNPGGAVSDARFFGLANQLVTIENFYASFRCACHASPMETP